MERESILIVATSFLFLELAWRLEKKVVKMIKSRNAKRYKLREDIHMYYDGCILRRIEALMDFGDVKKGDLGGWIWKEKNLSQDLNSTAWVYGNAKVYDDARVEDDAKIYNKARVIGYATVGENARVYNNSIVDDNAEVFGNAKICNNSRIRGNSKVYGNAKFLELGIAHDDAEVCGNAIIRDEIVKDYVDSN
jgi:NDP-sugar pyrophosphorylase family protein